MYTDGLFFLQKDIYKIREIGESRLHFDLSARPCGVSVSLPPLCGIVSLSLGYTTCYTTRPLMHRVLFVTVCLSSNR